MHLQVMNINVRGAMVVAQIGAQSMSSRGVGGAIVNVSSQASMVGLTDHAAYCASKGAMDQLTRVMAVELGPMGIRTNSVNPTVVMTAMGKKGERHAPPCRARTHAHARAHTQMCTHSPFYILTPFCLRPTTMASPCTLQCGSGELGSFSSLCIKSCPRTTTVSYEDYSPPPPPQPR